MIKLMLFLCFATIAVADVKRLTDKNLELFKYDPSDVYSLPEDIDDDKPAVVYSGDAKRAKVEKLQNLSGNKKYKLELKTQNGIQISSVGKLKDDKTFVVSGSYSFTGADGKRYRTRYTADEFGYHPITDLDLEIPEPKPASANSVGVVEKNLYFGGSKNRFQFLNQNLDLQAQPSRGSDQSGDDYSFASEKKQSSFESHEDSGYDYSPPTIPFSVPLQPSDPARQYLPVL